MASMSFSTNTKVFVGNPMGTLTEIKFSSGKLEQSHHNMHEFSAVSALSWDQDNNLLIGYSSGAILRYNPDYRKVTGHYKLWWNHVVGVTAFTNNDLLAATLSGNLYVIKHAPNLIRKNEDDIKTFETIVSNPFSKNIVAIGGVRNDVQLIDVSTRNYIFRGRFDSQDMQDPPHYVSVSDIAFSKNHSNFVTATYEGQVRLYDVRAQREPVQRYRNPQSSFTSICCTNNDWELAVGSATGALDLIDIRRNRQAMLVKIVDKSLGRITKLRCINGTPLLLSSSMDRYFRIHDLNTNATLVKEYIRISLTTMLVSNSKETSV